MHMAVKLKRIWRWLAFKELLQETHGISVHFSNIHSNYYTAWKYVSKEDPDVLESDGHPDLWNSKPPKTSKACEKKVGSRRVKTHKEAGKRSQPRSKKRKRLSNFELPEVIVQRGIKSRTELLALAQEQRDEGKTDIAEFVLNRGARAVAEIIDTAWEMKNAKEKLARQRKTRLEI